MQMPWTVTWGGLISAAPLPPLRMKPFWEEAVQLLLGSDSAQLTRASQPQRGYLSDGRQNLLAVSLWEAVLQGLKPHTAACRTVFCHRHSINLGRSLAGLKHTWLIGPAFGVAIV